MQPTMRRCTQKTNHRLSQAFILIALVLLVMGCVVASASTQAYTVQPGDTLAQIAAAHDTTVDRLVELNQETYPSLATDPGAIEVGWKLKVPDSSGGIQVTVRETPSLGSGPAPVPMDRGAFEIEIVRLVNEERVKAGLTPLEVDRGLMQFARERSEDMVKRGYRGHKDPVTGEVLYVNPLRATGFNGLIAENIAYPLKRFGSQAPNQATMDWKSSSGHSENLFDSAFHRTGIGVAVGEKYFVVTQLFAE